MPDLIRNMRLSGCPPGGCGRQTSRIVPRHPALAVLVLSLAASAAGLAHHPGWAEGVQAGPALTLVEAGRLAGDGSALLNGTVAVDAFETGGRAYLVVAAAHDDGIQVVDVTDPSKPILAGSLADDGDALLDGAYGVDVYAVGSRHYAVVAAVVDDGIQIVDVTDPARPVAVSGLADGAGTALDGASSVAVFAAGGRSYAAVTAYREGIQLIDVTDPASPAPVSHILDDDTAVLDGARGVDVFSLGGGDGGTYAVVAARGDDGIQLINVTDPANPVMAGSVTGEAYPGSILDGARGVDVFSLVGDGGTYAVVAAHAGNGIQVVNVTDPANPVPVSRIPDGPDTLLGGAAAVTTGTMGDFVYVLAVSMFEEGVQAIDMTDPAAPVPVDAPGGDSPSLEGTVRDVVVFERDGRAYAAVAAGLFSNRVDVIEIVPGDQIRERLSAALVPVSAAYVPGTPGQSGDQIAISFSVPINGTVHADRLHVRDGGSNGAPFRLSGTAASGGDPVTVAVAPDQAAVVRTMSDPRLDIDAGAVFDRWGSPILAVVGHPVEVPDLVPPGVASAAYDASAGLLALEFTEPLDHAATDYSGLAVLGSSGNLTLSEVGDRTAAGDAISAVLNQTQRGMVGTAPILEISNGAVSDRAGNPVHRATVTPNVTAINRAPTADAGIDQTAIVNQTVTLDGSGSGDPDGDTISYAWSQASGDAVTLSDTAAPSPTFTAPDGPSALVFRLNVTDGTLHSADTVNVTVQAPADAADGDTIAVPNAIAVNATAITITHVDGGSGFVPFTDGMAVSTDMPRFRGTSDGYDSIRLQVRDSDGTVTQIGSGTAVNGDGSFQRGRTTLADGAYTILVGTVNLGTITVETGDGRAARSVSVTHIHDGSGFVPFTDGMAVSTDMPRFRGTSDGYDSIRLQVRDSDGAVTQIGSGTAVNGDGSFQRGRTTLADGAYTILVGTVNLGTITVETGDGRAARSVSVTHIHDGSGFVPFTDGMAVSTDMPRFRGTSDGYDSIRLQVRDSDGAVTQIGSGTAVNGDGSFQRGRTTLADGTYSIFVNSEPDKILGTFVVRTGG